MKKLSILFLLLSPVSFTSFGDSSSPAKKTESKSPAKKTESKSPAKKTTEITSLAGKNRFTYHAGGPPTSEMHEQCYRALTQQQLDKNTAKFGPTCEARNSNFIDGDRPEWLPEESQEILAWLRGVNNNGGI